MCKQFQCPLRIYSKTLAPEEISKRLGLDATRTFELESCRAAAEEHVWELEPDYTAAADDFPGRLNDLFRAIRGHESRLLQIRSEARLVLWAACLSQDPETTVHLPPEVLRGLADLGIDAYIAIYATSDDDADDDGVLPFASTP